MWGTSDSWCWLIRMYSDAATNEARVAREPGCVSAETDITGRNHALALSGWRLAHRPTTLAHATARSTDMSTQLVGVLHNKDSRPVQGQLVYAAWDTDPASVSAIYFHGKAAPDIYLEPGSNRRLIGAARNEPYAIRATNLSAIDIACQGPARVCSDLVSTPTTPGTRTQTTLQGGLARLTMAQQHNTCRVRGRLA